MDEIKSDSYNFLFLFCNFRVYYRMPKEVAVGAKELPELDIPDLKAIPGVPSVVKKQLLESPFGQKIMHETELTESDVFFTDMATGLVDKLAETDSPNLVASRIMGEDGPMWAIGLIQAVKQLNTGAAGHVMGALAAKAGDAAAGKMESVASILNGLTAEQTAKFLTHVANNPTGFNPASIAAQLQVER